MDFRTKLRWLIILSSIIRCIFANFIELGNDEVYYFTYAEYVDWNHFDHPPLVGILIRFFTLNLHWVSDFSIRLGAIFCAALNTYIIANIARSIAGDRAGLIAAILFTASLYSSIISGLFILPDSLANTFWLLALFSMLQILKTTDQSIIRQQFLVLGLWIGLGMLCKVHCIFLWIGVLGYILCFRRDLFLNKWLYIGILISLICVIPIWIWNEAHQYVNFKFHSQRVGLLESGIRWDFFGQTTFGQIFYNNPFLIYMYVIVLFQLYRSKFHIEGVSKAVILYLLFCSLPIIFTTTGLSLFRQTLPHWSGAGFFGLMLLASIWIDAAIGTQSTKRCRRVLNIQLSFTLGILILALIIIRWYPGNLIGAKQEVELGKGDVSLDMIGWKDLAAQFRELRSEDIQSGRMKEEDILLVNNWYPAGHLYYYVAKPLDMRLIAQGKLRDIHKFAWVNLAQKPILQGENAYFISPSNTYKNPNDLYTDNFETIQLHKVLEQKRAGHVVRKWYIYHLKNAKHVLGNQSIQDYQE